MGFSQGSIMSLSVALTRPDLIKGAAIMSGRLLEEIKPQINKGAALSRMKIFISHGTNDPVLNINQARSCVQFLKENNLNPEYHEYPEQHTISNAMFQDMLKWLNK
jgi:phospholipase/carboxylesterase